MMAVTEGPTLTEGLTSNRVLIVDDDRDFADSLAEVLESHGYRAIATYNGSSALHHIEQFDPHVALIDLRLGVENGTDLIERMRAQRPDIVCIMMTAYAALDSAVQALRNRADDYLRKPLDPQSVLHVIHDAVCRVRENSLAERRERLASVGSLAAGVAHDLNNVLTIVLNETELIDRQIPEQDEEIHAGLHSIRASTQRAAQITRNLLLIARGEPASTPCTNAREVLEELKATVERSLPTGARLVYDLQVERDVDLAIGSGQLYQVVLNLLVNARDAIRDNGMVILRSQIAPTPAAATWRRGSTPPPSEGLLIKVADNGVGIDPSTMEHLFEPFYTTKHEGNGLGLATAYGLVSACGGEMFVESKLGVGTEFAVWIPRANSQQGQRPSGFVLSDRPVTRQRLSDPPKREVRSVLLCDDDPMILHALSRMLRDLGYDVSPARTLHEAWETWQSDPQRTSIVITDVRLGKERGTELVRRVLAARPDVRVVLMSGDLQSIDTRDPVWNKVTHLQKPFNRAALVAALGALGNEGSTG